MIKLINLCAFVINYLNFTFALSLTININVRCHKEEYRQNTAVKIIALRNDVSAIIATLKSVSF